VRAESNVVAVPEGYRQPPYKAQTPTLLPGAETLSVAQAQAMHEAGVVMIDATPLTIGAYGAMNGQWVIKEDHETIAGAVWLPNIGRATLQPWLEAWFAERLVQLSGGDKETPLIFFCRPDCWMSWNAGRRALSLGYQKIYWFRPGLPGWKEQGLPTETAVPAALPTDAAPIPEGS
jgi:PQQ-dependent catabolism-associated CXXCW motif protein